MDSLAIKRTPDVVAAEINSLKAQTINTVLFNSIEIGRRLTEAKELLPHGEFQEWLTSAVNFKQSTANNLMKIFEEYGNKQITMFGDNSNSQTFGNLTYSKAVALLSVPAEEREQFAEEHNVADISVSELKAEIKKHKEKLAEAEEKLCESKEKLQAMNEEAGKLRTEFTMKSNSLDDLKEKLKKTKGDLKNEKVILKLAEEKIGRLEEELKKPVTVEVQTVEKIPEEVQKELDQLRAEAKAAEVNVVDLKAEAEVRLLFNELQGNINSLLQAVDKISSAEQKKKYGTAVGKLLQNALNLVEAQ